ncbi:class I SAM-dependent methyltransferase [Hymenobacter sp. 15J16-1T3B]|uniref:class I SAM-dependent methyltransferase n=1 Tax=Hymenobacter sp. 15J16-1T3B TaxID=2886941 RepID=UPI001D11E3C8|nr:class I SAM-dependent methyltransferase [Hymenobacter sp. 15J16-1T3B]MCC3160660.1 class I SAM-dependent methyltransferase [Hymenobacter sp. 15J16-1T3B]
MSSDSDQPEFWEASFAEKQAMWGFAPANSALVARDWFVEHAVRQVLVPGMGYGRNAQVFTEAGMTVTGIELSQTAIDLARQHYGGALTIYHGSVTAMPFDNCQYQGIFCHALIHLLDGNERKKFLHDCYRQLSPDGCMVFSTISKQAPAYGQGRLISPDRYERFAGAPIFFYDRESIRAEFGDVGLVAIREIEENQPFYLIQCRKGPP